MFRLYWIAFAPARKKYRIGLLVTHKNGDFGAISATDDDRTTFDDLESGASHIGQAFELSGARGKYPEVREKPVFTGQ